MIVTTAQIRRVKDAGYFGVEDIAAACNRSKCPFYLAMALVEKESGAFKGRNVYGNDKGGALAGLSDVVPVSEGSYEVFRVMVDKGILVPQSDGSTKLTKFKSNGVGPVQITYTPFLRDDMPAQDLEPWRAADTVFFGLRLLWGYYQKARAKNGVRDSIRWAGTWYNAGSDETKIIEYGEDLLEKALAWKQRVGDDDYT